MSRIEKTLAKWETTPTLVDKEEIFTVLTRLGFKIDQQRFMGNWSDGVPVKELTVTDKP